MTPDHSKDAGVAPVSPYVDPAYTLKTFRETLANLDERFTKMARQAASLRKRTASSPPTSKQLSEAQDLSRALDGQWTEAASELWFTAEIMRGGYVVSDDGTEVVTLEELAMLRKRAARESTPTAMKADVLAEASAIARSASGDNVDWSREPLTRREANIRRVWIQEHLEDVRDGGFDGVRAACKITAAYMKACIGEAPADIKAAYQESSRKESERYARRERDEFKALADEIDDDDEVA